MVKKSATTPPTKKTKTKTKNKKKSAKKAPKVEVSLVEVATDVSEVLVAEEPVPVAVENVTDADPSESTSTSTPTPVQLDTKSVVELLQEAQAQHKAVKEELASLARILVAAKRESQKNEKRFKKYLVKGKKKSRGKPHRSGIMQPRKVSAELSKFMKKVLGSEAKEEYSRVDVLKAISAYVKKQELQDQNSKRFINLDKYLRKIFPSLKGKKGEERLQFTTVMKHIGPHFPPTKSAVEAKAKAKSDAMEAPSS